MILATLATQATASKILVNIFACFPFGNISLPKALKTSCLPLKSLIELLRVSVFFLF